MGHFIMLTVTVISEGCRTREREVTLSVRLVKNAQHLPFQEKASAILPLFWQRTDRAPVFVQLLL